MAIEYKEVKFKDKTDKGYEKIIDNFGIISYRLDGKLHRIDGPARVFRNGTKIWFINGCIHREGAPAVIKPEDGYQAWYTNDKLDREDGPAVIWADGVKEYYIDGVEVIPSNYHEFTPLQLAKLGLI